MTVNLINKYLTATALVAASTVSMSAMAGLDTWFKHDNNFVTFNHNATSVELYVPYPQLHDKNCGIGIALNFGSSRIHNYETLTSQLAISSSYRSGAASDEMVLSAITNQGALYRFDYDTQYYGTFVTIEAKYGQTFGDILTPFSSYSGVHALTTAVSCEVLNTAS
ncbi:hypothetical protein [Flocculibacter collagenilyticus]|uniref:hypothetical protein n=1 Tax=Flocculibacter collagenilyticus TaxID=2744479 RepID=UPI0018F2BC37|nr:hypothetical protein [Flocculibacter collagenilyticus]